MWTFKYIEEELEYSSQSSRFCIEKALLETFSLRELLQFIKDRENDLNEKKLNYQFKLGRFKDSWNYYDLCEFEKYAQMQVYYHFEWWHKLEQDSKSLELLKQYKNRRFGKKISKWKKVFHPIPVDVRSIPIESTLSCYMTVSYTHLTLPTTPYV